MNMINSEHTLESRRVAPPHNFVTSELRLYNLLNLGTRYWWLCTCPQTIVSDSGLEPVRKVVSNQHLCIHAMRELDEATM